MFSIGKGIIGSAAEEGSRKCVYWKEDTAYILPHCQGIACGWVHKLPDEIESNVDTIIEYPTDSVSIADTRDVVIYSLKVTPEMFPSVVEEWDGVPDGASSWVRKAHELFHQCLTNNRVQIQQINDGGNISNNGTPHDDSDRGGVELSNDESSLMSIIIDLASNEPKS